MKQVEDAQSVIKYLKVACANRVVGSHDLNTVSSRSHLVMTVRISQQVIFMHSGSKPRSIF